MSSIFLMRLTQCSWKHKPATRITTSIWADIINQSNTFYFLTNFKELQKSSRRHNVSLISKVTSTTFHKYKRYETALWNFVVIFHRMFSAERSIKGCVHSCMCVDLYINCRKVQSKYNSSINWHHNACSDITMLVVTSQCL